MSVTSGSSPYRAAANSPAKAPSKRPSWTSRAPSALEAQASQCTSGSWAAIQCRTCGWATGWLVTVLMSASLVPGRTSSAKLIGSSTSR